MSFANVLKINNSTNVQHFSKMFFSKSLPSLLIIIWSNVFSLLFHSIHCWFSEPFSSIFDSIFLHVLRNRKAWKLARTQILPNKLAHQTHNWIRHFRPYILFYVDNSETISEKEANKQIHVTVYIPYNFKESLNISNLYHFFTSKMVYVNNRKKKC